MKNKTLGYTHNGIGEVFKRKQYGFKKKNKYIQYTYRKGTLVD